MIRISDDLIEKISALVRQGYPNEICGLLIGKRDIEIKTVEEFQAVPNLNQEEAQNRFNLDPKEFERIDKESKARGLEIVGIYHSHPDSPAEPSERDRSFAWPVYSYVIFSIQKGKGVTAKSWMLNEADGKFQNEELDILGEELGEA